MLLECPSTRLRDHREMSLRDIRLVARGFNPWIKMKVHDFGFWSSPRQSINNLSPKTGEVDGGILFPINEIDSPSYRISIPIVIDFFFMFFWLEPKEPKVQSAAKLPPHNSPRTLAVAAAPPLFHNNDSGSLNVPTEKCPLDARSTMARSLAEKCPARDIRWVARF